MIIKIIGNFQSLEVDQRRALPAMRLAAGGPIAIAGVIFAAWQRGRILLKNSVFNEKR